ncbi:MAG: hypothetical protein RLZZ616_2318 [Pseudomonadota bacterium]
MIFIIHGCSVNIVLMAAPIQLLFIQAEPHHRQGPFPHVTPRPHRRLHKQCQVSPKAGFNIKNLSHIRLLNNNYH